jgi:hypothetical protein
MLSNYITRASYGDGIRIDNSNSDFNNAINAANNAFYDNLNSVMITDEDYSTKYAAVRVEMDTYTTSIVDQLTSLVASHQSSVLDATNSIRSDIESAINDFVFNRPLLRVVNFLYPVEIVHDESNTVTVEVTNIGKYKWTGWIGVTVTDEYYKKLEFLGQIGSNTVIGPGETRSIKRDIILPKVVTWKGEPRNLGKTLTYKIVVNTIK